MEWKSKVLFSVALGFALWGIACGGGGSSSKDSGTPDTPDTFDPGPGDLGQPDTSEPELPPEIEEQVCTPECTLDDPSGVCKEKFKDLGQCQVAFCNLETGCAKCDVKAVPNGTNCDDGKQCTEGDKCVNGVCESGNNICDCLVDADCAPKEDNDLCNGTLVCSKDFPFKCVIDPATVVTCDKSGDVFCMENRCKPDTGKCEMTPVKEGEPCDDANVCTEVTKCQVGVCASLQDKNCDDNELCTDDLCDPKLGCVHKPNTADCDDGNACTENDKCGNGTCKAGTPKICDNKKFCDGLETCDKAVGCVPGTPPVCDDKNSCTEDFCNLETDKCDAKMLETAKEGPADSATCSNGIDDDCDGKTDKNDPQCGFGMTALSPAEGPSAGGSLITVAGSNLDLTKTIVFGGKEVEFKVKSAASLSFTAPPHDTGNVDITFSDGWVSFTKTSVFRYTGKTSDETIGVTFLGPASHEMKEGDKAPDMTFSTTIQGVTDLETPEPTLVKAQVGYGKKGTLPWADPSWIWVDAEYVDATGGAFNYVKKELTVAVGGYFNVCARVSIDGGYTFAYGDLDGSLVGGYTPATAAVMTVFGVPKAGSIVINEIMWMGSNANWYDEWVELRNMTPAPMELNGFKLTSAGNTGSDFVFEAAPHTVNNLLIEPYGYFLLAEYDGENPTSSLDMKADVLGNNTMVLPNNAPVTYKLISGDGKVIDTAVFSGLIGIKGDADYGKPNYSMERNAVPADGTKDANWHTAWVRYGWDGDPTQTANYGTPRGPNSDIPACSSDDECKDAFPKVKLGDCEKKYCKPEDPKTQKPWFRCDITAIADGETCDDGLFCNVGETCISGKCGGGTPRDCSDGSDCTIDSCDEAAKVCKNVKDPSAIEGPASSDTCTDGNDNDCDDLLDGDDPQCRLAVTSASPKAVPVTGGWSVTISGGSLDIVKNVWFGETEAVQFVAKDDQTMTATVPAAQASGDVDIKVSDGVVSTSLENGLRYIDQTNKIWANTQAPEGPLAIQPGDTTEMIFGRVWAEGITDSAGDPNLILAEIGYGPEGTDPFKDMGWSWFKAEHNPACPDCGDNYEYMATLTLTKSGNFDVAFRFSIDGGYNFAFGGLDGSGPVWNPDKALKITVESGPAKKPWANTQAPLGPIEITLGETTPPIYGRVWVDNLTNAGGDPGLIQAEIGFGPAGTNPETDANWTWSKAVFNEACLDCGENFEYMAVLTPEAEGEYLIGFRFSVDSGVTWIYGDLGDGSADGWSADTALKLIVKPKPVPKPWANTQWPVDPLTVVVGSATEMIYGRVFFDGITNAGGDPTLIFADVGYGPEGSDPAIDANWVWTPAGHNATCLDCGNNYEYMGTLTPDAEGSYLVGFRFSADSGTTWIYGDLGDGSADGWSPQTALKLTVTPL